MSGKKQKEWLKKCLGVNKAMLAHKFAWIFKEPVDAQKLNLPDYYDIIKNPMDLGTVKVNCESGLYRHPDEFERDMQLIFDNAKTYNPPGSDVHVIAVQMEDQFRKKYTEAQASILQKYEEEASQAAAAAAGGIDPSVPRAGAKAAKEKDRSSTKRLLETVNFTDSRPMSFEEKRHLTNEMNQLSSKKLGKIVEIIHYKHPKLLKQNEADLDEIEIDIDQVDAAVLRAIQDFVTKALASSKKKRRANGE